MGKLHVKNSFLIIRNKWFYCPFAIVSGMFTPHTGRTPPPRVKTGKVHQIVCLDLHDLSRGGCKTCKSAKKKQRIQNLMVFILLSLLLLSFLQMFILHFTHVLVCIFKNHHFVTFKLTRDMIN